MENKNKRIEIRCSEEEKTQIDMLAKESNMNISGYILKRILNDEKGCISSNVILNEVCELLKEVNRLEMEYAELNLCEIKERCSRICHYL